MQPAPAPLEMARLNALLLSLPEGAAVEPGSARALTAAARSALQIGRGDDAVALGQAALALEPKNARAWAAVGDALWSLGQAHDARVAYEEAIAIDDKDLGTAVACARAQLQDGAPDRARALLTFVLTRTHSDEVARQATALLEAAQ